MTEGDIELDSSRFFKGDVVLTKPGESLPARKKKYICVSGPSDQTLRASNDSFAIEITHNDGMLTATVMER